ncbi:MAG TPA: DUF423 domain-containing protein [Burkholderiaceae bacterium]|nr:DUF423 domain-containing protein [Burkholderiaceae bacterium]
MTHYRTFLIAAALIMLSGVAAGAFGAHALAHRLAAAQTSMWQTAVLYQLVHGLGLVGLASLAIRLPSSLLSLAANLMLTGIILFSGSLYALSLSGSKWLGPLTPIGGLCLISSWAFVAIAGYRAKRQEE